MPTKPAPKTKANPKTKPKSTDIADRLAELDVKYVEMPIMSLKPYPGNARKGDVKLIVSSILVHGLYKPYVLQESTKYVLAGNHTLKAAMFIYRNQDTANNGKPLTAAQRRRLALLLKGKVMCAVGDYDDDEALEIVLMDNKANDAAGWDGEALAELLKKVKNAQAAGYDPAEIQAITNAASRGAEDAAGVASQAAMDAASLAKFGTLDDDDAFEADDKPDFSQMDPDELEAAMEAIEAEEETTKVEPGKFESASDALTGPVQLDDDIFFPSKHPLQIPEFRKDMLVEKLPDPLMTWAGLPTRNWPDDDVWWFYNHGSERTEGMNNPEQMILAFYCHDEYIDAWWYNLSKYVAKAMNTKITMAVSPNYTIGGMPAALSIFQLYKARYIARFLQEVGIRIIPDLNWILGDMDFFDRYIRPGFPVGAPYVCRDLQSTYGGKDKEEEAAMFKQSLDELEHIIGVLKPQNVIVYCNNTDFEAVRQYGLSANVIHQKTRLQVFGELMPKKQKRTTL